MCRFKEIKCGWEISTHNVPVTLLLNKSEKYARVKRRWVARWEKDDGTHVDFSIPRDYRTDGNSIPSALYWLEHKWGTSAPAAVVHDKNYEDGLISRLDADKCFYDMCIKLGVSKWRAWMMYRGLRAFGWMHYKEDKEQTHVNYVEAK